MPIIYHIFLLLVYSSFKFLCNETTEYLCYTSFDLKPTGCLAESFESDGQRLIFPKTLKTMEGLLVGLKLVLLVLELILFQCLLPWGLA